MQTPMAALHEEYIGRVNLAVAEDRWDLVQELGEEYLQEALHLILATA